CYLFNQHSTILTKIYFSNFDINVIFLGSALLAVLLAGYLAQKYGLPPPLPKIVAVDLGTTFSSIGAYQAITGRTDIIPDETGRKSIPSVVAFLPNGTILVGSRAVEQQEHNPFRTIYDAKRFIGKVYNKDDLEFQDDRKRYPFNIKLDNEGRVFFEIPLDSGIKYITPEDVGSIIISYLRRNAEQHFGIKIKEIVISVPAEFDQSQRNATARVAELAGMELRRLISEPTAAALAYGLDKKKGVEYIVVIDLGGGTLDVSVLWLQGGIFITLAMAGNNRLGGQDFNDRIQKHLMKVISENAGSSFNDKEDLQQLRLAIETAKIQLTSFPQCTIDLHLRSVGRFLYKLTREEFESLNEDLFESIIEPIEAALKDAEIGSSDIDEIVLVGGSTRIPRVRRVVGTYFNKAPNHGVDPELAVATGGVITAGVIGGGWPLQACLLLFIVYCVTSIELPPQRRKKHIYSSHRN
ncbi:unnamed protein product, partial [Dracunculus medinensis]|uniref:Heat shock 70 kDa protein 13 n=1 Tax=Dracunculus medinensis TaxID=318479 RepID=A0A0N4UD65_DRAME